MKKKIKIPSQRQMNALHRKDCLASIPATLGKIEKLQIKISKLNHKLSQETSLLANACSVVGGVL